MDPKHWTTKGNLAQDAQFLWSTIFFANPCWTISKIISTFGVFWKHNTWRPISQPARWKSEAVSRLWRRPNKSMQQMLWLSPMSIGFSAVCKLRFSLNPWCASVFQIDYWQPLSSQQVRQGSPAPKDLRKSGLPWSILFKRPLPTPRRATRQVAETCWWRRNQLRWDAPATPVRCTTWEWIILRKCTEW